ncbi:hypothetical protein WMW72_09555 [Paenibacillus filicis]|uniref:Uncharacterized protein n=1 Tax=Paenibacillus filicis TaxID=669464 RepID=A0ABU9DH06_9BACL
MWLLFGVAGMLAWVLAIEVPGLYRKRRYVELGFLSLITLSVTVLCVAESLEVKLPNPLQWIEQAMGPYPSALYGLFH